MFRRARLHETEITESLIVVARRAAAHGGHASTFACNDDVEAMVVDGVTGPGPPSKQAALATALLGSALRAACLAGGRSSLTLMVLRSQRDEPRSKHQGETTMELCRNRRVIGMLERVRCRRQWQNRVRGQGGERAASPDRLVRFAGFWPAADRAGGRTIVAMAVCGHEGGRPCRGTAGDAARAEGVRGDAGQVGSQRCTRDRATDAAGLVPAGALQIDECARDPIAADGTQAGAIEASGRREQFARDPAWLWSEGWQDDRADIRGTDRGTGGGPPASADNRQGAAGGASGAADGVRSGGDADRQDAAVRTAVW